MKWQHHNGTAQQAVPAPTERGISPRRPVSHRRTRRSQPTIAMWAHAASIFRPAVTR